MYTGASLTLAFLPDASMPFFKFNPPPGPRNYDNFTIRAGNEYRKRKRNMI